jgi:molybdate transport system substrate-binding protein
VDDLIKQGKIAADTRVDIVPVGIGVAIREDAPKPDISSVDAFKSLLLSVKSVAYASEGATGRHFANVVDGLGITKLIMVKAKPNAPNRLLQDVAAREIELAITTPSSVLSAKGVQFVGRLPPEPQSWFVNTAGVSAN